MAPSFSRISSGALLLALAYNVAPVKGDFWGDVDNCELVLNDLPADLTTEFCHDWTYGYEPKEEYVTVTGAPVTTTEYPEPKTCTEEGYETSKDGYSTSTPYPSYEESKGYETSKATSDGYKPTDVPDDSTKVPDATTKAPEYPSATYGAWDVTVTSTTWTTYWTTATVYDGYPAVTPAPYRRQLGERAAWCVDRPCRLVQYDDDTIVEACKKYLHVAPKTKTVNVPGYTVTVTGSSSYPTDCKKKEDGYKPDPIPEYKPEPIPEYTPEPVPEYPTEKDEGYEADPYPIEPPKDYPTEVPEYTEAPAYPEETYPTEEPEYDAYPIDTPAPYSEDPAPYPEDEYEDEPAPIYEDGSYEDGSNGDSSDDSHYNDGSEPWEDNGGGDYQGSDDKQPWESDFDTNYDGPDGPKPWDDVDQTSEFADAIEAGGYDDAASKVGLDDAPWNALPVDFPENYGGDYSDAYNDDNGPEYEGDGPHA